MIKQIYTQLHSNVSPKWKGFLSKNAFRARKRPIIRYDNIPPNKKFSNGQKGGLIISADFEMAWAWRFTKTGADPLKKGRIERDNIPKIVRIFEEYSFPITFATVGHLFLEKCQKSDHDWMRRIPHFDDHWKYTSGDWFDHDPHSNYLKSPEWYGPDLIKMILDSKISHEIGTHTFSHIDFSYRNCPAHVANDEIYACIEAAKPLGVKIESIVFPGGTFGNIETLQKFNVAIYRKRGNIELAYPYRDAKGLLVSPSSGSLEYNLNYGWTPEYYLGRLEKYIDRAIESNTVAHLWFHPSLEPFLLENIFPKFLRYAAEAREKGLLWIGPMNKIAEHINLNKVL